jgi:hypothetical protein
MGTYLMLPFFIESMESMGTYLMLPFFIEASIGSYITMKADHYVKRSKGNVPLLLIFYSYQNEKNGNM